MLKFMRQQNQKYGKMPPHILAMESIIISLIGGFSPPIQLGQGFDDADEEEDCHLRRANCICAYAVQLVGPIWMLPINRCRMESPFDQ